MQVKKLANKEDKFFSIFEKHRIKYQDKKRQGLKPYLFSKLKLYRRPGSNRHVREDTGF